MISYASFTGFRRLAAALLLAGVGTFVLGAATALAQAVHPDVSLTRPYTGLANTLGWMTEGQAPRVGVYAPPLPAADSSMHAYATLAAAEVKDWEYLLLGLGIPYRILEDSSLTGRALGPLDLLVLPDARILSPRQKELVGSYLEQGGSVIAIGEVGTMDTPTAPATDRFMETVFGLRGAPVLPEQAGGVFLTLRGHHSVTAGLPDGYSLNIGRSPALTLAFPLRNTALGTTADYAGEPLPQDPALLVHGRFGAGEFVWLGFSAGDVARDAESQRVYQALLINAMACLTQTPSAAVDTWPGGAPSAFALAVLPEIGHQPYQFLTIMDVLMEALEDGDARATFFLTTDEAVFYPQLVRLMAERGEIALSAENDDVLMGLPAALQAQRLANAVEAFRRQTGHMPAGLYPPGGLYDVGTLKAMHSLGLQYLVDAGSTLRVPALVAWEDELDYRDSLLLADTPPHPLMRLYLTDYTDASYWANQSSPNAMIVRMASALKADFDRIHASGGLFLYGFPPGIQALTQRRADVVEALARHARSHGAWMATLGEIDRWWRQRAHLSLTIEPARRGDELTVVLSNDGERIPSVAIALHLFESNGTVRSVDAPRSTWRRDEESGNVVVVLTDVAPGTTTLRVRLDEPVTMSAAQRP